MSENIVINEFNKITIVDDDGYEYIIEPFRMYNIFTKRILYKIVVMYRLKIVYIDTEQIVLSCVIPYYISDGWTNHFRANMLYPFYCFNNIKSKTTPKTSENIEHTLIKINLVKNINMNDFNNHLLLKTKDRIKLENPDITEEALDTLIENIKTKSEKETIDILSVLKRMKNLLNFLIGVNVELIIGDNYDEQNYRNNIYQPNKINSIERYTGINSNRKYPNDQEITYEDNIFRRELHRSLRHQITSLQRLEFYTLEKIILEENECHDIQIQDFNNYLKICEDNEITTKTRTNYINYIIFSRAIYNIFLNKIKTKLELSTEGSPDYIFLEAYRTFFISFEEYTLDNDLKLWEATCNNIIDGGFIKNKYLQLKNKYLQLKNNLF